MKYAAAITLMTIVLTPALAQAAVDELCIGQRVAAGPDGRMLGHLPYGQANVAELVPMPGRFALGAPWGFEEAADWRRFCA